MLSGRDRDIVIPVDAQDSVGARKRDVMRR